MVLLFIYIKKQHYDWGNVSIGHIIVHGCKIQDNVLIGMGVCCYG